MGQVGPISDAANYEDGVGIGDVRSGAPAQATQDSTRDQKPPAATVLLASSGQASATDLDGDSRLAAPTRSRPFKVILSIAASALTVAVSFLGTYAIGTYAIVSQKQGAERPPSEHYAYEFTGSLPAVTTDMAGKPAGPPESATDALATPEPQLPGVTGSAAEAVATKAVALTDAQPAVLPTPEAAQASSPEEHVRSPAVSLTVEASQSGPNVQSRGGSRPAEAPADTIAAARPRAEASQSDSPNVQSHGGSRPAEAPDTIAAVLPTAEASQSDSPNAQSHGGSRSAEAPADTTAAVPLTGEASQSESPNAQSHRRSRSAEPADTMVAVPGAGSPVASNPAPVAEHKPRRPTQNTAELLERGNAFLQLGDVTSARLTYRLAADAGDGAAALRLGATFDPNFLQVARFGRVPGDSEEAQRWYRRARDLGSTDAEILLRRMESAVK